MPLPELPAEASAEDATEIAELVAALDERIPGKQLDRNLLVATWNVIAFGGLTEKWRSAPGDSPKRDLHSVRCIAEIISRFDVVAIQEARANLRALRKTVETLGEDWGLILTDVTRGNEGNNERMAFLFDTRKVTLSGLACELVLAEEEFARMDRQFDRTPYAVSFRTLDRTFTLISLHVRFKSKMERIPELSTIAHWARGWVRDKHAWDTNLIVLGDFNIDRVGSPLYEALTATGLHVPDDLVGLDRTLGAQHTEYDQIAWFAGSGNAPSLDLEFVQGGNFDFSNVLTSRPHDDLKWYLSDHFPLWVEFSVRS